MISRKIPDACASRQRNRGVPIELISLLRWCKVADCVTRGLMPEESRGDRRRHRLDSAQTPPGCSAGRPRGTGRSAAPWTSPDDSGCAVACRVDTRGSAVPAVPVADLPGRFRPAFRETFPPHLNFFENWLRSDNMRRTPLVALTRFHRRPIRPLRCSGINCDQHGAWTKSSMPWCFDAAPVATLQTDRITRAGIAASSSQRSAGILSADLRAILRCNLDGFDLTADLLPPGSYAGLSDRWAVDRAYYAALESEEAPPRKCATGHPASKVHYHIREFPGRSGFVIKDRRTPPAAVASPGSSAVGRTVPSCRPRCFLDLLILAFTCSKSGNSCSRRRSVATGWPQRTAA